MLLGRCRPLVKPKAKIVPKRKKSHTGRNISILALLATVAVVAVALSGALSPSLQPTYVMLVHVYDTRYPHPATVYNLTESMLIENVNVTVSGVDQPTRFTPTGIIAYDQLPAGTYQITLSGNATINPPFTYVVGPNCEDRTPDGQCHALVPANRA